MQLVSARNHFLLLHCAFFPMATKLIFLAANPYSLLRVLIPSLLKSFTGYAERIPILYYVSAKQSIINIFVISYKNTRSAHLVKSSSLSCCGEQRNPAAQTEPGRGSDFKLPSFAGSLHLSFASDRGKRLMDISSQKGNRPSSGSMIHSGPAN